MTISKQELRNTIRRGLGRGDVSHLQTELSKYYLLDEYLQFSPYAVSRLREYLEDYFDCGIVAAQHFVVQAIIDGEDEYKRLLSEYLRGPDSELWKNRDDIIQGWLTERRTREVNTRAECYLPSDPNSFQKEKLNDYIEDWLLGVSFIEAYLLNGVFNHTDNFIQIMCTKNQDKFKKLVELCLSHGFMKDIFANSKVQQRYLMGNDIVYLKDKKLIEDLFRYLPTDRHLKIAKDLYKAAWNINDFVSLAGNLDLLRELYVDKVRSNRLPIEEPVNRSDNEVAICFYSFSLLQRLTSLLPLFTENSTVCSTLLSEEIELLIANSASLRDIIIERESFYRMLFSKEIVKKNENYNYWTQRLNALFAACQLKHFGPEVAEALSYLPPIVRAVFDYPIVGSITRYLPVFSSIVQYVPSIGNLVGGNGELNNRTALNVELHPMAPSSDADRTTVDPAVFSSAMNRSVFEDDSIIPIPKGQRLL